MVMYAERQTGSKSRSKTGRKSTARPDVALIRDDVYAVLSDNETMGYVERVGNVFVALGGNDLSHAVEIGQSLSWDHAVHIVHVRYSAR